jgi:predicted ATPase
MTKPALRLLGPPCLRLGNGTVLSLGQRRLHQMLAVLGWHGSRGCSHNGGWVARDELAELLWPESRQAQARTNLRKLLLALRHSGVAAPEEDAGRLRWRPGTDIDEFAHACDTGEWQTAAEMGSGVLLEGLDGAGASAEWQAWLQEQRGQHQRNWRAAAAQALPLATPAQAIDLAERLLLADPQDAAGLAQQHPQHPARLPTAALAPLAPLVGREDELQQLLGLLQRSRLVTVLGPGGVGKSRLARHAADAMAARFTHGAAVVLLDDLSTPDALPARVADTLGLVLPPHADAVLALSRLLAARAMLLVLDGFEAVIDAAGVVPCLLASAPDLQLLLTSRERLDVDGECLLPLASLAVPAPGAGAEQALQSPAVRLFVERASALQPQFNAARCWLAVADICRRVGGLPLAIEWAAAWMRVLSAEELAQDIAQDLAQDLAGEGDAGPLAVFESSWRMLTPSERAAYAALAVFRGGFTREAARQAAGVGLAQLAALVDKSMLRGQSEGRLDMHPLVHAHARGKLARLDTAHALAAQHARWYLGLLQRSRPLPPAENENVLAAWHHAVGQSDADAVSSALGCIQWSALVGGRRAEAVGLLEAAALRFGGESPMGALLQAHQAWILLWLDADPKACDLARRAAQVLRTSGHASGLAMCLRTLGHAARRACQPQEAMAHFEQALGALQSADAIGLRAALLDALGMAQLQAGEVGAAREQFEQALVINTRLNDSVQRMYNHFNLAQAHVAAAQPEPALQLARAALSIGKDSGFPLFQPYLHVQLARVLLALGRVHEALPHAGQALACAHETGDASALAWALELRAQLALRQGDRAAAASALTEALQSARQTCNLALGPMLLPAARQVFPEQAAAGRWSEQPAPQQLALMAAALLPTLDAEARC